MDTVYQKLTRAKDLTFEKFLSLPKVKTASIAEMSYMRQKEQILNDLGIFTVMFIIEA